MKIERINPPAKFSPVTIVFQFDTKAELDAFGNLFNDSQLTKRLNELGKMPAYTTFFDCFVEAGADLANSNQFSSKW